MVELPLVHGGRERDAEVMAGRAKALKKYECGELRALAARGGSAGGRRLAVRRCWVPVGDGRLARGDRREARGHRHRALSIHYVLSIKL